MLLWKGRWSSSDFKGYVFLICITPVADMILQWKNVEETKKEKKGGREGGRNIGRKGKRTERNTKVGRRKQGRKKGATLWGTKSTFYCCKWLKIFWIKEIIFKFKERCPNSQKREWDAFQNSQSSKPEVDPHFLEWCVKQTLSR